MRHRVVDLLEPFRVALVEREDQARNHGFADVLRDRDPFGLRLLPDHRLDPIREANGEDFHCHYRITPVFQALPRPFVNSSVSVKTTAAHALPHAFTSPYPVATVLKPVSEWTLEYRRAERVQGQKSRVRWRPRPSKVVAPGSFAGWLGPGRWW